MTERVRLALTALASLTVGGLCLSLLPARPCALPWLGSVELLRPRALALLAFAPALWWLSSRSLTALGARRRRLVNGLRNLLLAALALALTRPVTTRPARRTATAFVVDVSDSIAEQSLADAVRYMEQVRRIAGGHQLSLVTFAKNAERVPFDRPIQLRRPREPFATDIERALALARGLLAPDHVAQLVLFSDLQETHGVLANASARLRASDIALFVAPDAGHTQPEVGVSALRLPSKVRVGESFVVQAELFTRAPTHVSVHLLRDGEPNLPESERTLALAAGSTSLTFRAQARGAGTARYRLELTSHGADRFVENNQFERSTRVLGPPRVLYVERTREQAEPLAALLRGVGFEVDVRVGATAPESSEQLADVAFYILSDVPASELSKASMQAVVRFVDDGGGFMMVGGERSFGPGGYSGTPLETILPVALDGSLQREEPTIALMLAIDKSGSMAGEKLERAKEAALATASLLGADNYLGVIGFDAEPLRVVRLAVASQRSGMARSIATLAAGGGTALFPALDAAYADLTGVRARVKHVVVLTDGQSQEEALEELVRSMRADGITVSSVGVGDDVNRGLLTALAHAGGGRAYFTRDPSRIPRLFTEEAELVAHPPLVERELQARQALAADFLRGIRIEDAPALHGFVATRRREAPSELVLVGQRGDPLLARKRSGRGWSLAFTSDLKSRWSSDWFRWRQLPTLVAQLVREHMRREREDELAITTELEDDVLLATIDVLSRNEQFVNGLTGELQGTGPLGTERVALSQVAPGRYRARLPLPALGSYLLEARLEGAGEPQRLARGDFAYTFPVEYALQPRGDTQAQALRRGFAPLPSPAALMNPRDRRTRERQERWPALLWLALAAFLLDVALRRLPERGPKRRPEQTST